MADSSVIIDLRRLLRISDRYIEMFIQKHPDHKDRVLYDQSKRGPIREYIYNRFWNILNEGCKYKFDELEEDLFIGQMFDGWDSNSWHRNGNKELIIDDHGSFNFLSEWVEELDNDIKVIIDRNRLHVGFKILEMDISLTTISVELWGDWRAKKWCEENDQEYRPA